VGAAILVCGMHIFLLATSDRHSPTLQLGPPVATATPSIELSTGSTLAGPVAELDVARGPVAEEPAPPSEAPKFIASTEEQPQITAEARAGDQAPVASASVALSVAPATKDETAVSGLAPEVTSQAPGETAEHGTEDAGDNNADGAAQDGDAVALGEGSEIAQPNQQAPSPRQTEPPQLQQPAPASDAGDAQQPTPTSDDVEQTASIAFPAVEPKPEQPSPPVPLPQRAPKAAMKKASQKLAAKEKPAPKLVAKSDQREKESSQITPRWKPMGLAPADKSSISLMQGQPKKPDAGGYSAKIWSALARKKPNAGQRGSTTVTFAIGPGGSLRLVRVSQSSGNARLDQLALATVRNAAPFPPPPAKQGAAAYTIRIDFH
jgi:periplasmic protein TonB